MPSCSARAERRGTMANSSLLVRVSTYAHAIDAKVLGIVLGASVTSDAKRKLTSTHKTHSVFAFARAPSEAQAKAHRDAAAPTAKGAPGQPSGAPQAKSPPSTFEDASTPSVPSDENDAASSPLGGVEEG